MGRRQKSCKKGRRNKPLRNRYKVAFFLYLCFTQTRRKAPMKQALSIVLLFIFLFNLVGYYGIHWLLLRHHHTETLRKLDANDFTEFETVTLRVPLTVPYPMAQPGYERVNGAFEYQGQHYKLVQQKLENDTLYVVCIRDAHETRLQNSLNDFIKTSSENPSTSQTLKLLNSFCKDFHATVQPVLTGTQGWSLVLNTTSTSHSLTTFTPPAYTPPPRL
jgi:hypothetical protein